MASGGYPDGSIKCTKASTPSAPVVMTIAGSDSGGGAGIQADIKSCEALGAFACTAMVALTAQNTKGVHAVHSVPVDFIEAQMKAVADDFEVSCLKTGMLPTQEIIECVAKFLKGYPGGCPPYVLDPVMVAASGDPLINENAISTLKSQLFPLATIVTPNVHEASLLVARPVATLSEMKAAALEILKMGPQAVIVKGGRLAAETGDKNDDDVGEDSVVDIFVSAKEPCKCIHLVSPKVKTCNTHGTGCTLAASIAAELAKKQLRQTTTAEQGKSQLDISSAVRSARGYVQSVLEASANLVLGHGAHGPLNHQRFTAWAASGRGQEATAVPLPLPPLREENNPDGAAYGPSTQALWRAAAPVLNAIQSHPFLAGLVDGNLEICKFKQYVYQDKLYLERFSRGLALLASKGPPGTVGSLATFASTCEIVEKALHESFLSAWDDEGDRADQSKPRSPACEMYTSWLLAAASTEPLPVALASFLPCFWVYLWIGKLLLSRRAQHDEAFARACAGSGEPCTIPRPEPYNKWIDTYAGPEFEKSVVKMLAIVEDAATASPSSIAAMERAFSRGCEMEFGFWDSAWRLEDWREFS